MIQLKDIMKIQLINSDNDDRWYLILSDKIEDSIFEISLKIQRIIKSLWIDDILINHFMRELFK